MILLPLLIGLSVAFFSHGCKGERAEGSKREILPPAVPGKPTVAFSRVPITLDWPGDYGLRAHDVNADQWDDLVAYAWGAGNLVWFENPGGAKARHEMWKKHVVSSSVPGVVDVDFFDVDSDGLDDFVCAWQLNVPPLSAQEGQIGWFRNPGNRSGDWVYYPIADKNNYLPGIHRVRAGKWTADDPPAVVGIPIFDYGARAPDYNNTPCSITYYQVPHHPASEKTHWTGTLVDQSLHICHTLRKEADPNTGRPFLIDDSLEGVTKINFTAPARATMTRLSTGDPPVIYSPYFGSQGVRVGYSHSTGGKSTPVYMAQIGPWEGKYRLTPGSVAVLYPSGPAQSVYDAPLKRTLLDTVGPSVHDVATGDFDGDGLDEFLVAQRGPVQGVWMFRHPPILHEKKNLSQQLSSEWTFWAVELESGWGASQLVARDFDGDGRLDFASTGFPGFPGANTGGNFVAAYFNDPTSLMN
jgi:Aldos-2-ulose dehydratase, beta-propeller domain